MLKNEILNIDGTNWLVREAVNEGAARVTIAHARVRGSIGGKDSVNDTVTADVVRLNDDGTECLPYGEKGGTDHSELVAAFQQRGIDSGEFFVIDRNTQAGRALLAANHRNRVRAGALDELAALAETDAPLYHDPKFLRSEILRVVAEAKATIAAAKAEAQAEASPAPAAPDWMRLITKHLGRDLTPAEATRAEELHRDGREAALIARELASDALIAARNAQAGSAA